MLRVFTGFDPREAVGWHVFMTSVIKHCGHDVAVTTLCGKQADGTNAFTYERFRVPEYCNWGGMALFVDGCDMLLRTNLEELFQLFNPRYAVQVVKHEYNTTQTRKYVGTEMEADNRDYPRKNWSSVMLLNCGHKAHFDYRQELRGTDGQFLHRFAWLEDDQIGSLPIEWNWLADEYGWNEKAKLLHWTLGIPGFEHYKNATHADEWHKARSCF